MEALQINYKENKSGQFISQDNKILRNLRNITHII